MANSDLPKKGFKSELVIDRVKHLPISNPERRLLSTKAVVSADAAHTYGNALCGLQQFLVSLFPPKTFRSVFIGTSVPKRQLRSTPAQLVKNTPPMLVMMPRIDYGQDGDRAFGGTLMFERIMDYKYQFKDDTMQPFLKDDVRGYKVEWTLNRWVMNVECMMVFNTLVEQINYMNYFQNAVRINRPFLLSMPMESLIPKSMINQISNITGIPVYDEKKGVAHFVQYLQSVSTHPITYKMKTSTQNDEFFRYFTPEVVVKFSNPDVNDGVRDGHITRLYEISFTARLEFNGVGLYCLSSPYIKSDHTVMLPSDPVDPSKAIVTMFTDELNLKKFHVHPGWRILMAPTCRFKIDDNEVPFGDALDEYVNWGIDYHLQNGMDPSLFLQIQFRVNSNAIDIPTQWTVDWQKRKIIVENPDLMYTYRLLFTVHQDYLHNLLKDILGLE
jgi:hypothetical protein